ncbi:MAG: glycosyltransferase [Patescibacteria group bacterium]|nr:glycosyltransferase [Patescibacteria group bacterium]
MSISIIIPTKNEQEYLPSLLNDLKSQTLQADEIIISDKSTDQTRDIAKSFGCKVVDGDDKGRIGRSRNKGAEIARSNILLYLDADNTLPDKDFLKNFQHEFESRNLDLCTFYIMPLEFSLIALFAYGVINIQKFIGSILKQPIDEIETAMAIKKKTLEKCGGFDNNVKMSEGQILMSKAVKMGYSYSPLPIWVTNSPRRMINISFKMIWNTIVFNISKIINPNNIQETREKYGDVYWEVNYENTNQTKATPTKTI